MKNTRLTARGELVLTTLIVGATLAVIAAVGIWATPDWVWPL